MLMKSKWVVLNPMTERVEYLYVRRQHRETFSKKWSIFTEAKAKTQDTGGQPSQSEEKDGEDVNPKPKKKSKVQKSPLKDDQPKSTNEIKQLLTEAFKLKLQFQAVNMSSTATLRNIENGGDWMWAQNIKFHTELKESMDDLDKKTGTTFIMELMTLGPDSLRKDFSGKHDELKEGLISWISLRGLIEKARSLTDR